METFKFGQTVAHEDVCDRQEEIKLLTKIVHIGGRAVVYGSRRFGKTSVVRNVIAHDFMLKEKSLAIYVDLFGLSSLQDMTTRFKTSLGLMLAKKMKLKSFLDQIKNYIKHYRLELSFDPTTGAPAVSLSGSQANEEMSLAQLFETVNDLSQDYEVLLVLDEFQDIINVPGLEAGLRSHIQTLTRSAVIVLGSKRHVLKDIFHNETKPFYGFGTDVEFGPIPRVQWLPYMNERFNPVNKSIQQDGVDTVCQLMRDVPNAIQELCQWIALKETSGTITPQQIHEEMCDLITNKSSRYYEKLAGLSKNEENVLIAVARNEPLAAPNSTAFLKTTETSASATRAILERLTDQGVLDFSLSGYALTDPLFAEFLRHPA
jgi:uncharacterized protein